MKVLVCGGRDYANRAYLVATLDQIHTKRRITMIIHGGGSGTRDMIRRSKAAGVTTIVLGE